MKTARFMFHEEELWSYTRYGGQSEDDFEAETQSAKAEALTWAEGHLKGGTKMKEFEAKRKALDLAGIEPTEENMARLEGCGYLTINTAANGSDYAWYYDGNNSTEAIVEVATGKVIRRKFISLCI